MMTVVSLIYKSRGLFFFSILITPVCQKGPWSWLRHISKTQCYCSDLYASIFISITRDGAIISMSIDGITFGVTRSLGHSRYEEKDYSRNIAYIAYIAYSVDDRECARRLSRG